MSPPNERTKVVGGSTVYGIKERHWDGLSEPQLPTTKVWVVDLQPAFVAYALAPYSPCQVPLLNTAYELLLAVAAGIFLKRILEDFV
ncbi:hypothetical protein ACFX11_027868 [Malus domestica]